MPITQLSEDQKLRLSASGIDASGYMYDTDTDEAVPVSAAGKPSTGETVKEAGKAFVRGASSSVSEPMQFAGHVGNLLKEIPLVGSLLGPGAETVGPLGNLLERKTTELAPRDQRMDNLGPVAGFVAEDVPGALGQLASLLIPGSLAAKSGVTAAPFLARAGVGLAGAMSEGEQTVEGELARQQSAGETPDEAKATLKGLAAAPVAALLESKIGAGRLIDKLSGGNADGLVKAAVKNIGTGALEEGSQQALQEGLVNETLRIDPKNLIKPMLVGGLVQGGAGTTIDVANRLAGNVTAEGTPGHSESAEGELNVSGVKPMNEAVEGETEAVTPPILPRDLGPAVTPAEIEAIMTIEKTGGDWTPANATEGDKAINTLIKNKVPLNPDMITEIYSLANNQSDKGSEALSNRVREHSINAMLAKQQTPKTAAQVLKGESQQAKQLNQLVKDRTTQEKEIEKLRLALNDATLTASERYLAQQKLSKFEKTLGDVDTEIAAILGHGVQPDLSVTKPNSPGFYSGESAGTATPRNRPLQPQGEPTGTEFKPESAPLNQMPPQDAGSVQPGVTFDTGTPPAPQGPLAQMPPQLAYNEPAGLLPQGRPPILLSGPDQTEAKFRAWLATQERSSNPNPASGPLTPELQAALEEYRRAQEGEQSLPFIRRRE